MRRRANLAPALALGLLVAAVAWALLLLPIGFPRALQLTLADALFIREGGPLLGVRPAYSDIVLVLWDAASQQQIGSAHPSLELDLRLYRALLEMRVGPIGDTRPLHAWDDGVGSFMDQVIAEGQRAPTKATLPEGERGWTNAIVRDVSPGKSEWFAAQPSLYLPHIAHNPIGFDASLDSTLRLRYYPLLSFDPDEGYTENMALQLFRHAVGLPVPDTLPLRETGIAAIWALQSGLATEESLPPAVRDAGRNPRPYPLGILQRMRMWSGPISPEIRWVRPTYMPPQYLVSPAVFWIDYVGPPGSFTTLSYADVLQRRVPSGGLTGKIVIVGDGLDPGDRYPVPTSLARRATRAEIVATGFQTIWENAYVEQAPIAMSLATMGLLPLGTALAMGTLRPLAGVGAGAVLLLLYLAYATQLFRANVMPDLDLAPATFLATIVLVGGYRYASEELARRRVADLFGRYVPRTVVAELLQRPSDRAAALGGDTREVTVLFADIRGFTAFSERFRAQEVIERLNALLEVMVECAFRHQGTVDKFIGDAIMVIYNAPVSQPDHVERAVRTALEMQRALAGRDTELAFGIGIHTGEAVVGTVGTAERMEYTAIGATVNLASRLCDTAQRGEVIVSSEVRAALGGLIVAEPRPPVRVKNIDRDLETYLVTGLSDGG